MSLQPSPKQHTSLPWEQGPPLFTWLAQVANEVPLPPLPDSYPLDAKQLLFGTDAAAQGPPLETPAAVAEATEAPEATGKTLGQLAERIAEQLYATAVASSQSARQSDDDADASGTAGLSLEAARAELYRVVLEQPMLALADPLTELLCAERDRFDAVALAELARWLMVHAAHRGPLHLGLVLLGLVGEARDVPALVHLSRHDEFTLFCAVAAGRILDEPCDTWWKMAQLTRGCGRVVLVDRLATFGSERADIQQWLLSEGFRLSGLESQLALSCAKGGRLAQALSLPTVSPELLRHACDLMRHLLRPDTDGAAPLIAGYAEARYAVAHTMRHLVQQPAPALAAAEVALYTRAWLDSEHGLDCTSAALRRTLAQQCEGLLSRSHWLRVVSTALQVGSEAERLRAFEVADGLGLDLWDAALERFAFAPLTACWVRKLSHNQPRERLAKLIRLGRCRLPLTKTTAEHAEHAEQSSLDDEHVAPHAALYELLRLMATDMPALYEPRLVAAALQSPALRIRHAALVVLAQLPPAELGNDVHAALATMAATESEPELAEQAANLHRRATRR